MSESIESLRKKINICKKVKLEDVKLEDVDDINDIKIDRRKPSQERIIDYLEKVKNPYVQYLINERIEKHFGAWKFFYIQQKF